MTHQRIQRLELELAELRARLWKAENEGHEKCHTKLREAVYAIERISGERDRARGTAVALEQELAAIAVWNEALDRDGRVDIVRTTESGGREVIGTVERVADGGQE